MASMVPYVIRQGDHLSKLAARMGFDADTVWSAPKNANLRKLRPDPHVLCVGDILFVPEPKARAWLPVQVGSANQFTASVPTVKVSLTLAQNGKAIANARCIVHGLLPPNELTSDGDGTLSFDAPAQLDYVTLEFPALSLVRRMHIGHLDPVEEPTGVLQRLRNMGYVSPVAQTLGGDRGMALALKAFQQAQGLPATGQLDDATRDALADTHGS
jgi:Putative peptidoglycan binding domain